MNYYERKERESGNIQRLCWYSIVCMVVLVILMLFASLFSGCKTITKTEVIEKVRIDTLRETKWQKDSVWLHDSVYIHQKNDTLLIEKWHTKWRDRLLTDTVYRSKIDSIPYPVVVTEWKERELTAWQQFKMHLGEIMLMLLIAAVIYGAYRIKKRIL